MSVALRATYRVQLTEDFGFDAAAAIVPRLARLGVSHAYVSPITAARPGSTHGYDVIDHGRIDPRLGGEAGFERLAGALRAHGMGLVLDVVPNHAAADPRNPWWADLLRHGPAAAHARHFDVDWDALGGRVLLPVLGRPFGEALEGGDVRLALAGDEVVAEVSGMRLPLDPATWPAALGMPDGPAADRGADPIVARASAVVAACRRLPPRAEGAGVAGERARASEAAREALASACADSALAGALDARLRRMGAERDGPCGWDAHERVLDAQAWRLAWWRTGPETINYRRFFDVNELAGLRVEDEAVFEDVHRLPLALVASGHVAGLRIDHVDGLREPGAYLRRLADRVHGTPVWVEKILGARETLPAPWPVAGTTGYDALNAVTGLLVPPDSLAEVRRVYAAFTGRSRSLARACRRRKLRVMDELLRREERALVARLERLAAGDRHAVDLTRAALRRAVGALTASLPAYRTYLDDPGSGPSPSAQDRALLEAALGEAAQAHAGAESARALAFLGRVLLGPSRDDEARRFVLRWQQFTGPVMAKGLEDTAFYVHVPLLALNEVGGDLEGGAAVAGVDRFHAFASARRATDMNAGSTHDTKRGEDARARLALLASIPGAWEKALQRWSRWNRAHRVDVRGSAVPDANEEVLIYQSLLGAWPADAAGHEGLLARFEAFLTKAAREAKTHTTWLDPDEQHEKALHAFVRGILSGDREGRFRRDFEELAARLAVGGVIASLVQLLARCGMPGVPDVYQGSEEWNLSLVDPDNRRPPDQERLARHLDALDAPDVAPRELLDSWPDGRVKHHALRVLLRARRSHAAAFAGAYEPLVVEGAPAGRAVALARTAASGERVVAIAPLACLAPAWRGLDPSPRAWSGARVVLPAGAPSRWREAFTGETVTARSARVAMLPLLRRFPVALLLGE